MNDKKREEAIGAERNNEETDGRWDGRIEKAKNYGRNTEITKWDDGRTVWDEGERVDGRINGRIRSEECVDGRRKEELNAKYIFNKNKQ